MRAAHPLDRPVWAALTTRQASVARGDARALRFAPDHGLFAAAADDALASLTALASLVPAGGELALVETEQTPPPPGTALVSHALCQQMVMRKLVPTAPRFALTTLTGADAPAILALAHLTRPGPFFSRTHELGDFVGVKQEGRLVAMAGERMKPEGFTEVSAVCTHPGHRGRGYAGGLMRAVADRILARGETPFLHVYASNTGAIALYRSLGFRLRREIFLTTLTRPPPDARADPS